MSTPKGLNKKLDKIKKQFSMHYSRGEYYKAIAQAKAAHKIVPKIAQPLSDIAACYLYLGLWSEALQYARKALALAPNNLPALDTASQAYGELNERDKAKPFGVKALAIRDALVMQKLDEKSVGETLKTLLARVSNGQKIIAFSLFGDNPKYCETAYLNVLAQPTVYPGWVCRFYVDNSVPTSVKTRLQEAGAQVHEISSEQTQWFGTMWRFLALDDEGVERVIFRDADSLINQREAYAVADWMKSDKDFHLMRDSTSHTELILAGMWGCVRGALPQMERLISEYLSHYVGLNRFVDQFFLRECVWPYARQNSLQHDSVFDSPGSFPFPRPFSEGDWHVGDDVNTGFFEHSVSDGNVKKICWALVNKQGDKYCVYETNVIAGKIKVALPRDLLLQMQAKELNFKVI